MGLCSTLSRGLGKELAGLAARQSFICLLLPELLIFNKYSFNEQVLLEGSRVAAAALGLMGHHHLPAERSLKLSMELYPIVGPRHLSSCSWEQGSFFHPRSQAISSLDIITCCHASGCGDLTLPWPGTGLWGAVSCVFRQSILDLVFAHGMED